MLQKMFFILNIISDNIDNKAIYWVKYPITVAQY